MSNIIVRGAVAALACTYVFSANSEQLVVSVQRVLSGDTFIVRTSQGMAQVRIATIDAPEVSNAYGERSRDSLVRLTTGKDVKLDCFAADENRRKFCHAYVGETDLGLAQVRSGMARRYRGAAGAQTASDRKAYEQAEKQAEARRLGLWGD